MEEWQVKHRDVMKSFLNELNKQTNDLILKGGTALMFGYGLTRFSEDIDLDGTSRHNSKLKNVVEVFCNNNGYSYRIGKDTLTVERYFIHYGNVRKPLKIESSYREHDKSFKHSVINGIKIYDINSLANMKANAYLSRNKIRDMHDVSFILNTYNKYMSEQSKSVLSRAIISQGIENFDYIKNTQDDPLIDIDKLESIFLKAYIEAERIESQATVKYNLLKEMEQGQNSTDSLDQLIERAIIQAKAENKKMIHMPIERSR